MPPRLPVLRPREVVADLLHAGFYIDHQTGSHARLLHHERSDLHVTVPIHNKDIPPTLLKQRILRQAGLTPEEFLKLL